MPDLTVTLSVGMATLSDGDDWGAWMKPADEALYRAKHEGRNRVVG